MAVKDFAYVVETKKSFAEAVVAVRKAAEDCGDAPRDDDAPCLREGGTDARRYAQEDR